MIPTEREGESPFIPGTTLQHSWDSTSLSALQTCPKYYEYVMIEGWRSHEESVHLRFGGWFASALEQYHRLRAEEASHGYAMEKVLESVLMDTWIDDAPWDSKHSKKTRETLVRSIIWYLENYKNDQTETVILENGKPAVELSFRFEIDKQIKSNLVPEYIFHDDGPKYSLCGHLDRVLRFDGQLFVQDQKTTGSTVGPFFFDQFNPHTQMSLYTLASRVVFNALVSGVMLDGVQIAVGFTAFARAFTMRSEDQLEEWLGNVSDWLDQAERYSATGRYPRNESSCGNYGGCRFRSVCSKSPKVRQQFLETNFDKKNPWNPLKVR